MTIEIDRRPLWLLILIRAGRPLFFALVAALFLFLATMPAPEGLSVEGQRAVAVFVLCLILWVSGTIPLSVTGLIAIVLVPLLGVIPRKDTYAFFGNEAVFFILGAFILAGAVMHSGLSNRIALNIMARFGSSPKRLLISIFLLASILSFFMSEHAVAAMLFPIVLDITKSLGLKPGRSNYGKLLFFALAWGCVTGGVATFLGGARVPLAVGILREATGKSIAFLDYSIAVFPVVVILLVTGYALLTRMHPIDIDGVEKAVDLIEKCKKGLGKVSYTEYATGVILILTILAWIYLGRHGLSTVALISVIVLFVMRLVKWKDVEEFVNWGIILMYGGAIVLGAALDKSGAARWLVEHAMSGLGGSAMAVFAALSLLTIVLTEAMSHAAVVAILLPVGISMAGKLSIDPALFTYAVAVPAGLAFMLPMATPASAIAVSSNYVTVKDMAVGGSVMCVVAWVVFNLCAYFYWPLVGIGSIR